jgi:hypothetical protein
MPNYPPEQKDRIRDLTLTKDALCYVRYRIHRPDRWLPKVPRNGLSEVGGGR